MTSKMIEFPAASGAVRPHVEGRPPLGTGTQRGGLTIRVSAAPRPNGGIRLVQIGGKCR